MSQIYHCLFSFANQMAAGLTCKIIQMSSCSCIFDVYSTYSCDVARNTESRVGLVDEVRKNGTHSVNDGLRLWMELNWDEKNFSFQNSDSEWGRLRWMDRKDLLESTEYQISFLVSASPNSIFLPSPFGTPKSKIKNDFASYISQSKSDEKSNAIYKEIAWEFRSEEISSTTTARNERILRSWVCWRGRREKWSCGIHKKGKRTYFFNVAHLVFIFSVSFRSYFVLMYSWHRNIVRRRVERREKGLRPATDW